MKPYLTIAAVVLTAILSSGCQLLTSLLGGMMLTDQSELQLTANESQQSSLGHTIQAPVDPNADAKYLYGLYRSP